MMAIYARVGGARRSASIASSIVLSATRTNAMDQARNVAKIVTRFKNRVRGN
ncbi:hypothetical protein [Bradyrhizobium sp. SZCCHNR1093]|uniref:hypothetical protein n=1 Tax=Bradyrhizobium sp. SZCCHNR1093 TaxID=3057368 RepID=UPI0028EF7AB0|nr:hypothetical protein [Bradyrhizobium sp. SZCCHNR1093]